MTDSKTVLELLEKEVVLKTESEFNPEDFFKTRDGLYIWSGFNEILKKAEKVLAGTEFHVSSLKLVEDANDATIESTLPSQHIFSESDVCAVIAELVQTQSKGEDGLLLNNGYANIFYTPTLVVDVSWSGFSGSWGVGAWSRRGHSWFGGYRVFSPAN